MRPQVPLSEVEIQKIISLLTHTEMPISEIAAQLDCTRRSVCEINVKYGVRNGEDGSQPQVGM